MTVGLGGTVPDEDVRGQTDGAAVSTDLRSCPMRSRTVDLDGPVHLADFGGQGRPILLVHGIDSSHASFTAVGEGLSRLGWTTAVDLIGFGYTPLAGRSSDLRSNRRLLVRLLREVIGEPVVLVGTSMGGLLAMLTAAAVPEQVERMVLVGPGQPDPAGHPVRWGFALAYTLLTTPWLSGAVVRRRHAPLSVLKADASLGLVCHRADRVPEHVREACEAMARDRASMPWAVDAFLQAARSLIRELRRTEGYAEFVADLEPPTLLIHGRHDRLVRPDASRELARRRPDWRFELLEDVGHSPQLETPDRLVGLIQDWLGADWRKRAARPA